MTAVAGATTAGASHTYATAGTYVATLTVTDDFGTTDTATVTTVVTVNQPPVAAVNASPQSGPRPLAVTFDGSSSVDPEAGALTYAWDFGDGGTSTVATPSAHLRRGHLHRDARGDRLRRQGLGAGVGGDHGLHRRRR